MAKVLSSHEMILSPWVTVVQKDIEFAPGLPPERYHSLAAHDYVTVLARTPGGLIPIVRQYRPAVELATWELPSGLVDPGEEPMQAGCRELEEETGLKTRAVLPLGSYYTDTGRMQNRQYAFFVETDDPDPHFVPEPGMCVEYVSFEELKHEICCGALMPHLHISVVFLYELYTQKERNKKVCRTCEG